MEKQKKKNILSKRGRYLNKERKKKERKREPLHSNQEGELIYNKRLQITTSINRDGFLVEILKIK